MKNKEDQCERNTELVGAELIVGNTRKHGRSVIDNQFPSPIDGLKKVHRRILWSIKDKTSKIRGTTLISLTNQYHPHGSDSIYDAATKIGQRYRYPFPLISIKGDDGTYSEDSPAAARYNDFVVSDFTKDMYFSGTDVRTIPMVQGEDPSIREPAYLLPKIPMAMVLGTTAVGFGHSCYILPMKFENVCDLTVSFLTTKRKSKWSPKVTSKLIPYLPIWNRILNRPMMLHEYENGAYQECPMEVEGTYKIVDSRTIDVFSTAYGVDFKNARSKLISMINDKNSSVYKYNLAETSLSSHHNFAKLRIRIHKRVNILQVIDEIRKIMKISSIVYPVNNYVDNSDLSDPIMVNYNVQQVMTTWYNARYSAILGAKRFHQQKLMGHILTLEAYMVIVDNIDEVVTKIKEAENVSEILDYLHKRFDLSYKQAGRIIDSKLRVLMKRSRASITEELKSNKLQYDTLLQSFSNIDEEMIANINTLRRKYKTDTTYSSENVTSYKGIMFIEGRGTVLFDTKKELVRLGSIFRNVKRLVYTDKPGMCYKIKIDRKLHTYYSVKDIPYTCYTSKCIQVPVSYSYRYGYSYTNDTYGKRNSSDINCYISKNVVTIIELDGTIREVPVKDIPTRVRWIGDTRDTLLAYIHESEIPRIRITDISKISRLHIGKGRACIIGSIPRDSKEEYMNVSTLYIPEGIVVLNNVSATIKTLADFEFVYAKSTIIR